MRYSLLVKMFGLGLDRAWVRRQHGDGFFRKMWPELRSMELLGAVAREEWGWRLTTRGMFWLMLMMSEFFNSVNTYRDVMRAEAGLGVSAEPDAAPSLDLAGAGLLGHP